MGIRLDSVTKRYGSTVALDRLSLAFPTGKLTGFLGPNGAGKTTTFRSCLGLTHPQEGRIEVLGMQVGPDTHHIVKRVGAVVEEPGLHKTLNGTDNLRAAAMILGRGASQISSLLEFVDLARDAHRKVETYSKGMRQRLALAMAMLGDPEVLLLDEPLDGLDPAGQVIFRERLRSLVDDQGLTVVVSSHDMSDVEQLADHVVVINRGGLVTAGSLDEVLGGSDSFRIGVPDAALAQQALIAAGYQATVDSGVLRANAEEGAELSRALAGAGIYPSALVPETASLERVFLDLTGGGV
jgi:ABC-type multidrug transport system ATPase subunit